MRLAWPKAGNLAIALLIVAAPCAFLWDFLVFEKVFFYFDFEIQWIPFHQFARNALLNEGQSILWNPYTMMGFPQHAESQVGYFYPLNVLLHLLFPRQEYAISLSLCLHLMIGFWSAYRLARTCRLNVLPALHAAVCFAFSGFMFAQMNSYNIVLVACYLPLKLLLITWYFQRNNPRYLLYFALLLGIELLICHANLTFITTFAASVYFLALALLKKQYIARDFACFTFCILLAALLGAIQILPTYELMNQSWRAGGLSIEAATSFSLSFTQYLTSFFPMTFGVNSIGYTGIDYFEEMFFYIGTFGIILGLYGALQLLKRRDNRYISVIALIGLLGFCLSLGYNTPLLDPYRFLIHVPGFNFFRCPARWSLLLTLGLAILSGYGLQVLAESLKAGRRLLPVLTFIGITLLVPAWIYWMSLDETVVSFPVLDKIINPLNVDLSELGTTGQFMYGILTRISPLAYLLCMLVALLAIIAASAMRLPVQYCVLAIVVIGFTDLLFVNKPVNARAPSDFYSVNPWYMDYLRQNAGVYRTISSEAIPNMWSTNNYMNSFYGVSSPKGYAPIKLSRFMAIEENFYQMRPDILDYVGVKYEIVHDENGNIGISERESVFPRAFLLDDYAVTEDDNSAFQAFLNLNPENRKSYALISAATAETLGLAHVSDIVELEPGVTRDLRPVEITDYRHTRIELQGSIEQPAFLILTDIYYPGWHARVDGREVPIVPLQGTFRGIWLDRPGDFKVEMVYKPLPFRLGVACTVLGALILAAGFWMIRRRPRDPQQQIEPARRRFPRRPSQTYRGRGLTRSPLPAELYILFFK